MSFWAVLNSFRTLLGPSARPVPPFSSKVEMCYFSYFKTPVLELRVCNSWITNQILDIKNQKFELFFPKYDNFKRNQHTRCLSVYLPMKDEMMKEQNSNKLYIKIKNLLIFVFTKQYFSLNSNLGLSNFMQKRKNW